MAKDDPKASEKEVKTPGAAKKNSVIIDINPTLESVDLLKFNKTAVVTLLRMSPPTREHDEFIDWLYDTATNHSVEAPMVFVQDTGAYADSVVSSNGEDSDAGEDFFWLAPEDAVALAIEAYGDIVQPQPVHHINAVLEKVLSTYTDVVLVLPAEEAKLIHREEHNVEIVSIEDFDEVALAERMYNLARNNDREAFLDNLSDGIDYLSDEIVDMYQLYSVDEAELGEALTYGQRLKRAQVFRRNKRKIAIARDRMKRKIANTDQLKKRARKKAIQVIRKKVAGARGADYNNLSVGEKVQIDKRVEQRKSAVNRIAQKILPKLRKDEMQKNRRRFQREGIETTAPDLEHDHEARKKKQQLRHLRMESFDMSEFPNNKARDLTMRVGDEPAAKKRWHSMFNKDGSIKLDKRFKIWRDATVEEMVNTVMDPEVAAILESLIEKSEAYNIDQEVIREVFNRGMEDLAYEHLDPVEAGFNRVNSFIAGTYFLEDLDLMERAEDGACAIITRKELQELEKFADALLDKFGIDIEFTKHFGERMSDDRNNPCIKVQELRDLFRKIAMKEAKPIKNARDAQVVLKDIQKDLNIPIVINYKRSGEFEVVLKTIMRKKNFSTPNDVIRF